MTTVLNAYSIDYSFIPQDIIVEISTQADPLVIVATETDVFAVTGHVARIWSFPGLVRTNYIFNMYVAGTLQQLAYFDVVPSVIADLLVREDEQITVGVTPGLIAGNTSIVFDGTGGKPNYIGWNINPERLEETGRTQIRNVEYSWDTITGTYALLLPDDVFMQGEVFNIDFDPIQVTAGGSVGNTASFGILFKTTSYTVLPGDFGKKIICEPAGDYMVLTLPAIASVPEGTPLMVEVSKSIHCAVEISTTDTKGTSGSFIACAGDSFRVYKFIRSIGVYEWRADACDGNFRTAGSIVAVDLNSPLNSLICNGAAISKLKYARLYEYVTSLLFTQVSTYADWTAGENKYKFSYSDLFSDNFHVPDLRGLYLRATIGDVSGTYFRMMIEAHKHIGGFGESHDLPFGQTSNAGKIGSSASDFDNYFPFTDNGSNQVVGNINAPNIAGVIGSETRPNSRSTNLNVLI